MAGCLARSARHLDLGPVWHVILDDTLVERHSQKAPEARAHFTKRNRPRFLCGLAAVVERGFAVGAVPLLLRLVRTPSTLTAALVLLRALDRRLGAVRVLTDAWYMRALGDEAGLLRHRAGAQGSRPGSGAASGGRPRK